MFSAEPGKRGFSERSAVAFERRPLKGGKTVVEFVTDKLPTHVGMDPHNKRIDRNADDNIVQVGGG